MGGYEVLTVVHKLHAVIMQTRLTPADGHVTAPESIVTCCALQRWRQLPRSITGDNSDEMLNTFASSSPKSGERISIAFSILLLHSGIQPA